MIDPVMSNPGLVNSLAALLIVTSILVITAARPTHAVLLYALQSLVLVSILLALGALTDSPHLYLWALSAFVTKTLLVPTILYRTLRPFDQVVLPGTRLSRPVIILMAAVVVSVSALVSAHIDLPVIVSFKPALTVSLAHFFFGIACIVTQRNIAKQILGYCLMENGSHLSLALMASRAPELVEIGITTDAIFAVIIMTLLARRIQKAFTGLDSCQLMTLKG